MHHDTTTSVVVGGSGELERSDVILLDQMTAALDPCKTCGNEERYLTYWTPLHTVGRICCACCGRVLWIAPGIEL